MLCTYRNWGWKLSNCMVDSNGNDIATITAYSQIDCSGDILKEWNVTNGDTRDFVDVSPVFNKEEEVC